VKAPAFPLEVRRVVKIYRTASNGCDSYTVTFLSEGKRQRKKFADLNTAKREAEFIAAKIIPVTGRS